MNFRSPLKKIFTVIIWCLLGGTGLALLIAAINAKNSSLCQGVEVEINGGTKSFFLNKKDVTAMLESQNLLNGLHTKKISSFDLLKMENLLRQNNWVKEAQLYFDNNQILKISIRERRPVARIFTNAGNSYLIDSVGVQLQLPEKNVFRLPVFTGYPGDRFGLRRDSALNTQIKNLAAFVSQNTFWSDQIQEINITSTRNFVMTPLLGNQVIEFGDGNNYENKFHRLFVFYKEIIAQTGFDKYTSIKLAYANQVIATRTAGSISKSDSLQARKNILEMIKMARKMESDTAARREVKPLEKNQLTEQSLQGYDLPDENDSNSNKK